MWNSLVKWDLIYAPKEYHYFNDVSLLGVYFFNGIKYCLGFLYSLNYYMLEDGS